jgi:hypothetical protein
MAQLAALPQTSFTLTHQHGRHTRTVSDSGPALEDVVTAAQPTEPATKNAQLRVTVTAIGRHGDRPVTFALGELDPSFGNHPAYLALEQNGHALRAPKLVVPGDTSPLHTIPDASQITVDVQSPAPTTPASAGGITVQDGQSSEFLTAAQLASLPAQTLQVTFCRHGQPDAHRDRADTRCRAAARPYPGGPRQMGGCRRL